MESAGARHPWASAASLAEAEQVHEQVRDLLARPEDLYSVSSVEGLAAFLAVQAAFPEVYDLEANLALLRAYLMWPDTRDAGCTESVLCMALMRLQNPDFDLCLGQIPLGFQQSSEAVRALCMAEASLHACRFSDFWDLLEGREPALRAVSADKAQFAHFVRLFIAGVLSLTYSRLKVSDAMVLLHMSSEEEMTAFCASIPPPDAWTAVADPATGEKFVKISSAVKSKVAHAKSARSIFSPDTLGDALNALRRMAGGPAPAQGRGGALWTA